MKFSTPNLLTLAALSACCALLLSSCETTGTRVSSRPLPAYEPPIAKSDFQNVRTTAYTHTESDHRQYSNRNALGGVLGAASAPIQRVESGRSLEAYLAPRKRTVTHYVKTRRGRKKVVKTEYVRPAIGSAAADWSRWPAGTYFRVLSTGQIYKVDDYGWALSGRNTIDLYMATTRDMNRWGVRQEPIQVLKWGDRASSLALLTPRQHYKHIQRMVLQLQGQDEQAAALR